MLVDSHCHLDHFAGQEQMDVVARAKAAGVTQMVTIGTRLGSQAATVRGIADAYDGVFATVGIHPHNAGERAPPEVAEILAEAETTRFDASDEMPGEVGVGAFWTEIVAWLAGAQDLDATLRNIDRRWPS